MMNNNIMTQCRDFQSKLDDMINITKLYNFDLA